MGVLLGQERSVIRSIIRLLDMDWVVDIVDLSLGLDNRGVDSLVPLRTVGTAMGRWAVAGLWILVAYPES